MKEYLSNEKLERYIKQKIAKSTYHFIMRFLLFVVLLFLTIYFVFSYFPIYEFAERCLPIFPILAKFLMFLCDDVGKIVLVVNSFIIFIIIELLKLTQIK